MLLEKWLLTVSPQSNNPPLANSGLLYLFGYNIYGEIGNNTIIDAASPTQIGTRSWAQVATGASHTLALRSDSYLFAWGGNSTGQLGDGTIISKSSPIQLGGGLWQSISTKDSTSYGIRTNGLLYAWGYSLDGELGNNSFNTVSVPKSWSTIATGDNHIIAIRSDGLLFGWGFNTAGQLGDGTVISRSSAVQIGTSSWIAVTAGVVYSSAIRSDGALFTWGFNSAGQLGDSTVVARSSPVQIGTSSWTNISAGSLQTAGLTTDGQLYVWGNGASGQMGDSASIHRSSPVQVTSLDSQSTIESYATTVGINPYPYSWSQIVTGLTSSFGIQTNGTLWGWGDNSNGQLGDGTLIDKSSPMMIGTSRWLAVVSGPNTNNFVLALRSDYTIWSWGDNSKGELGLGDTAARSSPTQIGTSSWLQIASGASGSAYAISLTGGLFAWGAGTSGASGDNTTVNKSSPVQIGTGSWSSITGGSLAALAITSDGVLFSWGANTTGAVGDGTVVNRSSPVQVTSMISDEDQTSFIATLSTPVTLYSWTSISAGLSHALAIRSDGLLFTWGSNATGQLGDNTIVDKSSPILIGTSSWVAVAAYTSSAAIRVDNLLFTWGNGANNGQLGLGDLINRSSPTQVGVSTWSFVAPGSNRFFAIRSDGLLFAWGANTNGQLGDNTTVAKSSPVGIGSSSWTMASADVGANGASNGITATGQLFAWGTNTVGEIGDGTIVNKSSPVQISSLSNQVEQQNYATAIGYTVVNQSWTQISVGVNHTLAIRNDGALFAWGLGTSGQLGDSTIISKSSPVLVSTSSWTAVAAGVSFSAAVRSDGAVFTWGDNTNGQLGQVDLVHRSSPVQVGTSSWTNVSAAGLSNATFALSSDGGLFSWGLNTFGMLGLNDVAHRSSPVQVGANSWTTISGGPSASGIRSDGLLFTWGASAIGELGQGLLTVHRSSPVQVTSLAGNEAAITSYTTAIGYAGVAYLSWTQIASTASATAGITSDGRLWTWGSNNSGQLGDNTTVDKSSPVPIGTSSWTAVGIGTSGTAVGTVAPMFTVAIRTDGALFTWGDNTTGQLGDGTIVARSSPVQVGTSSWTAIGVGSSWIAARRSDSGLFTWGGNTNGNLGFNDTVHRSSPVQVGTSSWTQISAGQNYLAAIRLDSGLFTWGINGSGQLGSVTILSRSSPVQVGTSSWVAVTAGQANTLALLTTRALFAWGNNTAGRLGLNDAVFRSSPVQVGTSSWTSVRSSDQHSLGIRIDGGLFAWGLNATGQLGDNTLVTKSSPVQIGTSSWTQISAGGTGFTSTSSAIRSDGRLYTWGNNASAQLGNLRFATQSSPIAVSTVNDSWSSIASGTSTMASVRSDKLLYTWGLGTSGQLGDGTAATKSVPTLIGNSSWTQVTAGVTMFSAKRIDTSIWSWGLGTSGQLGDGTIVNKSSPVQIGTSSWTQVSAGQGGTSSAIRSDGVLFLWGNGATGQIGNYYLSDYASPTQLIAMNDSWSIASAGDSFMSAIRSDKLLYTWGLGTSGQLGDGTIISKSNPTKIGASSWISISSRLGQTVAIRSDYSLFAWGIGTSGQIGDSAIVNKSSPVQIGTSSWTSVSAGSAFSAAIKNNGSLYLWGLGSAGQLGDVRLSTQSSPVIVKSVADTWYKTASGVSGSAVIRSDKLLYTWGLGTSGQLGDNTIISRSAPLQIGSSSWTNVKAGVTYYAGLLIDYSLYTWGLGTSGQLGDGTIVNKSSPVQIGATLPDGYFSALFNGTNQVLQVPNNSIFNFGSNDFTIEAWIYLGVNSGEQVIASLYGYSSGRRAWYVAVGQNPSQLNFRVTDVGTSATNFYGASTLSSNTWYHVAFVKSGTTKYIFLDGILDNSGTTVTTVYNNTVDPVYIGAVGPTLTGYFNGYISNLRILNGTALYTSDFSPPTTPLTAITNTVLLTDQSSTLIDNSSYHNSVTGTGTPSGFIPFEYSAGSGGGWIDFTAGNGTSGGVDNTNTLFMWGTNTSAQLGNMRFNSTSSPIVVKSINDSWSLTSSGGTHVAAVRSDNTLWTWGLNTSGQMGDSTVVSKSIPSIIGYTPQPNGYYSVSFNGTSNYLQIAANAALVIGTGSFTLEAYVYLKNYTLVNPLGSEMTSTGGASAGSWFIGFQAGTGQMAIQNASNATLYLGSIVPLNTWVHVAFVRNSGVVTGYVNGVGGGGFAFADNLNGAGNYRIGRGRTSSTNYFAGLISNYRFTNGTALYTSDFTPPTGPLSAVSSTDILTCQSSSIIDNSVNHFTITNF